MNLNPRENTSGARLLDAIAPINTTSLGPANTAEWAVRLQYQKMLEEVIAEARPTGDTALREALLDASEHECWDGDNFIARPLTHLAEIARSTPAAPASLEGNAPWEAGLLTASEDARLLTGSTLPAAPQPDAGSRFAPPKDEVNRIAQVLIAEWERREGPVTSSYVASFADLARAVIRSTPAAPQTACKHGISLEVECEQCYYATPAAPTGSICVCGRAKIYHGPNSVIPADHEYQPLSTPATPHIECLCGDIFTTTKDMAMHLWIAHGHEAPPPPCDECEHLRAIYNTALSNGLVLKAQRYERILDAHQKEDH